MSAAEEVERARRIASDLGLARTELDRLAVSLRSAARLLSVSHSQLEKLVARGDLAAFHVGRSVRVELVELVAFIERNRRLRKALRSRSLRERVVDLLDGTG